MGLLRTPRESRRWVLMGIVKARDTWEMARKFGRTSTTFDQVVFSEGRCVASAKAVTVMIDEATRRPTPLPAEVKQNFRRWVRRGVNPDGE